MKPTPSPRNDDSIGVGFNMVELVGEGAEAKLYATRFLGQPCVAKVREKKAYRHPVLDARLRSERTKTEARLLHRAKLFGVRCPLVRHVDLEKKELVLSRLHGRLLSRLWPSLKPASKAKLLKQIGEPLGLLHAASISHGDFTTSNVMLVPNKKGTKSGEIWIIDFGLAAFTTSAEDHAQDLLLMKKSLSQNEYAQFLKSYRKTYAKHAAVERQLADIERRGRYVVRSMAR